MIWAKHKRLTANDFFNVIKAHDCNYCVFEVTLKVVSNKPVLKNRRENSFKQSRERASHSNATIHVQLRRVAGLAVFIMDARSA